MVHTGANSQPGGLKNGLLRLAYHSLGAVTKPTTQPIPRTAMMNRRREGQFSWALNACVQLGFLNRLKNCVTVTSCSHSSRNILARQELKNGGVGTPPESGLEAR